MSKRDSKNPADEVFVKNEKFRYETDSNGIVTIFVENTGFFNVLAQKLLKKPRFTQIHLEEFGSFIWQNLDGRQTVFDIAQKMEQHFGDKAKPTAPRLLQYLNTMISYDFIKTL